MCTVGHDNIIAMISVREKVGLCFPCNVRAMLAAKRPKVLLSAATSTWCHTRVKATVALPILCDMGPECFFKVKYWVSEVWEGENLE